MILDEIEELICPHCSTTQAKLVKTVQDYRILRCGGCNFVYAWPRTVPPNLYEAAYHEEGDYRDYLALIDQVKQGTAHLTWAMKQFLNTSVPKGHLLDIGCSTGTFLAAAQQRGWQVSGIEISEKAAQICQKVTGASVYSGTLSSFQSEIPMGAITAWEVLEHVPDPVNFIHTAVKRLGAGGVLALSVPNWKSPWTRTSRRVEHWPPYHLAFWEPSTLRDLLIEAGLQEVEIAEKPFAWEEEVGGWKWLHLPVAILRSYLLQQKGMHIFARGKLI
jgi:SAM-dependent methyltransferase